MSLWIAIASVCTSVLAGTTLLLVSLKWFEKNPAPTKENAWAFASTILCIFFGYYAPLAFGLVRIYETMSHWSAYYIDEVQLTYKVKITKWFGDRPPARTRLLEEPVRIDPPNSRTLKIFAVFNVFFVFLDTLILPFARGNDGGFGWLFGTIVPCYIGWCLIWVHVHFTEPCEDEKRRAAAESEARRIVREELSALLQP